MNPIELYRHHASFDRDIDSIEYQTLCVGRQAEIIDRVPIPECLQVFRSNKICSLNFWQARSPSANWLNFE
jgi:hypothetical protein